jgi:translation initiation factor 1
MTTRAAGGLVYSTDTGRTCPECRQGVANCQCKQNKSAAKTDGVVRVSLDTKGRGGKSVTVIKGLPLGAVDLALLGKQLRSACGSGGTTKDGVIEVQGSHCAAVMAALEKLQFKVKRVGGQPVVMQKFT